MLEDLEAAGYTCWPLVVGADDVGAPHRRKRVWIMAHCSSSRREVGSWTEDGKRKDGRWRPSLTGTARLWPTATRQDAAQSGAAGYSTESSRHPGTTLTDAASGLWATSLDWGDATDTRPQEPEGVDSIDRERKEERAATPRLLDWSSRRNCRRDSAPEMAGTALAPKASRFAGLLAQGSHSTSGKRHDSWPMRPDITDHAERVRLGLRWETRDGERWTDLPEPPSRGALNSLNSRWVAQLMGFPSDWCDVPTERLCALWATRSSRRSSRRSAGDPRGGSHDQRGGRSERRLRGLPPREGLRRQPGRIRQPDEAVHPILKPHQRAIVRWMVAGGRRACFCRLRPGQEPDPTGGCSHHA